MFAYPAARVRAGIHFSLRIVLPVMPLLLLTITSHAADTQAEAVLKKMVDLYQNARTCQYTMTMTQSGKDQSGKPGSVTRITQIRYKSPNMIWVQQTFSGTGSGAGAAANNSITTLDGKASYQYYPSKKAYAKGPGQPVVNKPFPANLKLDPATIKMLPATTIAGHAAYVIQAQQLIPPTANIPPDKMAEAKAALTMSLAIDKSTYYLLRLSPAKQPALTFTNQSVNAPIADSVFTFIPPAGAKLVVPQPRAGGPGAAGPPPAGALGGH